MIDHTTHIDPGKPVRHGPFVSVRPLKGVHGCQRMIMLHEQLRTNHLLYRLEPNQDTATRRRVFDRLMGVARLKLAHILVVQHVAYDATGRLCVITDYPGNQDGLVTLDDLVASRGGLLEFGEVTRLLEQLLMTSATAAEHGIVHGPVRTHELLVDRRGCVQIELFGLEHAQVRAAGDRDALADQVRSIAQVAATLIVGDVASTAGLRLGATPRRPDRAWELWFDHALDPLGGFESPTHALSALPTTPEAADRIAELKPPRAAPPRRRLAVPRFRLPGAPSKGLQDDDGDGIKPR